MTTLVTGGTGFLGRHLVRELLVRGEEDVRVFTRRFRVDLADMGVEICEGDLGDPEDVRRAVEGVETVYHLAGRVERDPKEAHRMYELHVDGTRRLLDALRDTDVRSIVYASTSGTVGVSTDPDVIADDDAPTREDLVADWPYYLSKIYAERVCERFIDEFELPIVIMRPTLLLGPGDREDSSTGDVALFLQRKIPTVPSGGLSFVDVRDVAAAFVDASERGAPGRSYLLGACNLTMRKFFRRLEHLSGVRADRAMRAVGSRSDIDPTSVEMANHYWYIDSSRAERDLDWSPRNPNETLRDTIEWLRDHHPELAAPTRAERPDLGASSDASSEDSYAFIEELKER
jgi:dihydroflavonol-4-reductase